MVSQDKCVNCGHPVIGNMFHDMGNSTGRNCEYAVHDGGYTYHVCNCDNPKYNKEDGLPPTPEGVGIRPTIL
mgnify:CR=1 FL=1